MGTLDLPGITGVNQGDRIVLLTQRGGGGVMIFLENNKIHTSGLDLYFPNKLCFLEHCCCHEEE